MYNFYQKLYIRNIDSMDVTKTLLRLVLSVLFQDRWYRKCLILTVTRRSGRLSFYTSWSTSDVLTPLFPKTPALLERKPAATTACPRTWAKFPTNMKHSKTVMHYSNSFIKCFVHIINDSVSTVNDAVSTMNYTVSIMNGSVYSI